MVQDQVREMHAMTKARSDSTSPQMMRHPPSTPNILVSLRPDR
jgi:hypothetical protein